MLLECLVMLTLRLKIKRRVMIVMPMIILVTVFTTLFSEIKRYNHCYKRNKLFTAYFINYPTVN